MLRKQLLVAALLALAFGSLAIAAEPAPTGDAEQPAPSAIQHDFNRRYKDYLNAGSQMLLPFPKIEAQDWKKLRESRPLRKLYTEPDKYYNNKVYSFTLYQASDDDSYYLDAKGGFWGMDELFYGPMTEQELQ